MANECTVLWILRVLWSLVVQNNMITSIYAFHSFNFYRLIVRFKVNNICDASEPHINFFQVALLKLLALTDAFQIGTTCQNVILLLKS